MIQIRKSYPTDAYTLIIIHDITWKAEYYDVLPNGIINKLQQDIKERVQHLKDQIEENNRIFVACDNEKIVGYIFYAKSQSEDNSAAEIREIYILPEYQKKGIGTQLFYQALEEIKKLNYQSLLIDCPTNTNSIQFFLKLGGIKKNIQKKNIYGYDIGFDIIFFDPCLPKQQENNSNEWNQLYEKAQENLILLNDIHKEIAVIMTNSNHMYLGISIKNKVCPLESALANMYLAQDNNIRKILILNRKSKPVLPCGKCRDLLINLNQSKAEILFDFGTLKTISIEELNPYYKDEEKN